jgi:rubrerythrin
MNQENVETFFKQQIMLEKEIIQASETAAENIKNILVRELILGINHDSFKHMSILQGLLALHTKKTEGVRLISEEERDKLKKGVETHLKLEEKAIETYKHLLSKITDPREKILVESILHDELRHHALLKRIYETVIKDVTFTEEDVFEMTWKDVIWQIGT